MRQQKLKLKVRITIIMIVAFTGFACGSNYTVNNPVSVSYTITATHSLASTKSSAAIPEPTRMPSETPVPSPTVDLGTLMLETDQDYYCRLGPNPAMPDVTGFKKGTMLPLLGSNNQGWYLVGLDLEWTKEKSCWIAGGVIKGDRSVVPYVTPGKAVPVHEFSNWKVIGHLTCDDLKSHSWSERGSGTNKYECDTVLLGSRHATIEYSEWTVPCPDFDP